MIRFLQYQFNCSIIVLHCNTYKSIPCSTGPKNASQYFSIMMFPLSLLHHLILEKYYRNTGSTTIVLIIISTATTMLLGLVQFAVFCKKLHHVYHAIFVTCHNRKQWTWKIGASKLTYIVFIQPFPSLTVSHIPLCLVFISVSPGWLLIRF